MVKVSFTIYMAYCTISINLSQFWNSQSSEILFRFMAIFDGEFFQPCDLWLTN